VADASGPAAAPDVGDTASRSADGSCADSREDACDGTWSTEEGAAGGAEGADGTWPAGAPSGAAADSAAGTDDPASFSVLTAFLLRVMTND
jgi:hypothetical protein